MYIAEVYTPQHPHLNSAIKNFRRTRTNIITPKSNLTQMLSNVSTLQNYFCPFTFHINQHRNTKHTNKNLVKASSKKTIVEKWLDNPSLDNKENFCPINSDNLHDPISHY